MNKIQVPTLRLLITAQRMGCNCFGQDRNAKSCTGRRVAAWSTIHTPRTAYFPGVSLRNQLKPAAVHVDTQSPYRCFLRMGCALNRNWGVYDPRLREDIGIHHRNHRTSPHRPIAKHRQNIPEMFHTRVSSSPKFVLHRSIGHLGYRDFTR